MQAHAVERIVVGVDGSADATAALQWGVEEARVHGATVTALLAWTWLNQYHPDRSDRFDPDYDEEAARATLAAWVQEAVGGEPEVGRQVVCDVPGRTLILASEDSDLLVLGARGIGGFEGLLLGSVSELVAEHTERPVAVVRSPAPPATGRVVVGIDGSPRAARALRWGAAEARARDVELDVVHAWGGHPGPATPWLAAPRSRSRLEEAARDVLDAALADSALEGLRVRGHLERTGAGRALIERAQGAGVVVAGTRGLGRITGRLLGSVSRQLLHHSPCPVVVV